MCFLRRVSNSLGEETSKRDPSSSQPLPMKSEIGHFTISDKNIRFVLENGLENQAFFSTLFLMISGCFWDRKSAAKIYIEF